MADPTDFYFLELSFGGNLKVLQVCTWTEIITQPSLRRILKRYTTPALPCVFLKRRLQAQAVFNGCVIIYVFLLTSGVLSTFSKWRLI